MLKVEQLDNNDFLKKVIVEMYNKLESMNGNKEQAKAKSDEKEKKSLFGKK